MFKQAERLLASEAGLCCVRLCYDMWNKILPGSDRRIYGFRDRFLGTLFVHLKKRDFVPKYDS